MCSAVQTATMQPHEKRSMTNNDDGSYSLLSLPPFEGSAWSQSETAEIKRSLRYFACLIGPEPVNAPDVAYGVTPLWAASGGLVVAAPLGRVLEDQPIPLRRR